MLSGTKRDPAVGSISNSISCGFNSGIVPSQTDLFSCQMVINDILSRLELAGPHEAPEGVV